MAVWSKINYSDLVNVNRIDGDYYKPNYLEIQNKLKNYLSLSHYIQEIIHPSEFKRIYSKDGYYVLRAQNVRPLNIDTSSNPVFVPIEVAEKLSNNNLKLYDILMTRTGANFGQTALYMEEIENIIATSHTFIIRTNDKIDSAYLSLFLNTYYGRELINQGMYGSSQPEIAPKFLKMIPIPRFDNELEQELSYAVLSAYKLRKYSKILYEEATDLLREVFDLNSLDNENKAFSNKYITTFKEAVHSQRLDSEYYNPKTQVILNKIQSIKNTTVSNNFDITNGFSWDSKKFLENNSGEPVIRIRDIKTIYIDNKKLTSLETNYTQEVNFSKAQTSDIVVGMDGVKYFYSSILEEECLVNQRVCHLIPKENNEISSEYTTFMINSIIGQSQLLRDMTIASTVGHITNKNVANLKIPVVSDEFHIKITSLIRNSIDVDKQSKRLIEDAKAKLEELIVSSV